MKNSTKKKNVPTQLKARTHLRAGLQKCDCETMGRFGMRMDMLGRTLCVINAPCEK